MKTVYIEKEHVTHVRLKNTLNRAIALYEFVVIAGMAAVADQHIEKDEYGAFHVEDGIIVQATSDATFNTVGQAVYFNTASGKFVDTSGEGIYLVGVVIEAKDGKDMFKFAKNKFAAAHTLEQVSGQIESLGTAIQDSAAKITGLGGRFFKKTVTLTSAAATTPAVILADADLDEGEKAYVLGVIAHVDGSTAWETVTKVTLQDTASVKGAEIAAGDLTDGATLTLGDLDLEAPIAKGEGFTAEKGLQIVGDAAGTGSDLVVTVYGIVA